MFKYILLRNKILLFLKWRQKPTHPILCYSSAMNMEKGNFTNFENAYKINKNSHNDNFLDYPDLLGLDEIVWIIEGPDNQKYKY